MSCDCPLQRLDQVWESQIALVPLEMRSLTTEFDTFWASLFINAIAIGSQRCTTANTPIAELVSQLSRERPATDIITTTTLKGRMMMMAMRRWRCWWLLTYWTVTMISQVRKVNRIIGFWRRRRFMNLIVLHLHRACGSHTSRYEVDSIWKICTFVWNSLRIIVPLYLSPVWFLFYLKLMF
jgi:hypothetical protein